MNTQTNETESQTLAGRILVLAGLLVVAVLGIRTIGNADFWTHLVAGRWIAGNGIPRVDSFSFTAAGQPWMNISWLYDRLLYSFWNIGGSGSAAISSLHLLAVPAAFALMLPVRRKWAGTASTTLALLLSAWILAPRFVVGPQSFALLFTAIFVFVLARVRSPMVPWIVLLPMQILWVNFHASFLIGPMICVAFAADAWIRKKSPEAGDDAPARDLNTLIALTGATLIVTLLNPYHVQVYGQAFAALGARATEAREWISPFSSQFSGSVAARHLVTFALIIGAGGLVSERRRLPLPLTILAVGAAFFAVLSLWYADFFALLAFPFLALSLRAIGDALAGVVRKLLNTDMPQLPAIGAGVAALLVFISLCLVVGNTYYTASGSISSFGLGAETSLYPASASAALNRPGFPDRAFNLPTDGGFLLWKFPDRKVFIDSRAGVYSPDIFTLGGKCLAGVEQAWQELEEKWETGAAIINCTVPGATFAVRTLLGSRRWLLVYFDGTTAVLVRALSANRAIAEDAELQEQGLALLERERAAYADRLGRARRPANSPRLIGAANFYMALGRYPELRAVSMLLTRGAPEMASAWQYLGIAELQVGNLDAAERALNKAAQMMPKNVWPLLHLSQVYAKQGDKAGEKLMLDRARKVSAQVTEAFLNAQGFDSGGQPSLPEAQ
jgi:hypothetical protein